MAGNITVRPLETGGHEHWFRLWCGCRNLCEATAEDWVSEITWASLLCDKLATKSSWVRCEAVLKP